MIDALHDLLDDRPLVEVAGHVMGGGADQLDAAAVGLMVGLGALETGQEGMMDVHGAAGEPPRRVVREDLHVAREYHELARGRVDECEQARFLGGLGLGRHG